MLFTESTFVLVFLPAVLGLYFVAVAAGPHLAGARLEAANTVIIGAGAAWLLLAVGDLAWFLLLTAAGLAVAGRGLARAAATGSSPDETISAVPELILALALTAVAVLYGVLKTSAGAAEPSHVFAAPRLLAPLGLTVFVCHAVSYTVDLYRGAATPGRPADALTYLLCFPFLVAGPLIRYADFRPQLERRSINMATFAYGVRRFATGFVKVWWIAQTLAGPADQAFAMTAAERGPADAWLGLICFSLQIYFDFSGYADMALGLGRMLGFRLPESFNIPYAATSVREFWDRWNRSLMTWARFYLPVPGRRGAGPMGWSAFGAACIWIGAWHGPSWNLVVWGGVHGVAAGGERTRWGAALARAPRPLRHAALVTFVALSWVVFRTDTLTGATRFGQTLIGLGGSPAAGLGLDVTLATWVALLAGLIAAAPTLPAISRWIVTVDAMVTAVQMIGGTAALFVWTRLRRVTTVSRTTPASGSARDARDTDDG